MTSVLLSGCASRIAEREAENEVVRHEMERLEQEQGQWLVAVNESRERVERLLAEKRKETEISPADAGESILAELEILAMERDAQAPFRYRGRVRFRQPATYAGREVDAYLLSYERDLTRLTGQAITAAARTGILDQQLEPLGPFSVNGASTFAAIEQDGEFRVFDDKRFANPVTVSGRVIAFHADPENKSGYFMFEILFFGDLAVVEIESPALYRGTKLRVLVEPDAGSGGAAWKQVGAEVTFSTMVATVAWEPWGFTRAAELQAVTFGK